MAAEPKPFRQERGAVQASGVEGPPLGHDIDIKERWWKEDAAVKMAPLHLERLLEECCLEVRGIRFREQIRSFLQRFGRGEVGDARTGRLGPRCALLTFHLRARNGLDMTPEKS